MATDHPRHLLAACKNSLIDRPAKSGPRPVNPPHWNSKASSLTLQVSKRRSQQFHAVEAVSETVTGLNDRASKAPKCFALGSGTKVPSLQATGLQPSANMCRHTG